MSNFTGIEKTQVKSITIRFHFVKFLNTEREMLVKSIRQRSK